MPSLHWRGRSLSASAVAQSPSESWLDRLPPNWNAPAIPVPRSASAGETPAELARRCDLPVRRSTAGERALAEAGWLPYLHVDRQIVQGEVEIVAGMAGADATCSPVDFNVFVFVGGRLAGTLSPRLMTSRSDGAIGAVRLAPDETISADFARYANADAHCCPSGRVTVRYRIERAGPAAVIVPVALQVRRG